MDYFLARWYIVKDLPFERLKELHRFERAVYNYARSNRAMFGRSKIIPPLWWQEGALFLRGEFKNFWQTKKFGIAALAGFKEELAQLFAGTGLCPGGAGIFKDIDLAHKCDLAINASTARKARSHAAYETITARCAL